MFGTIHQSTICLKTVMLEYLRTGEECYKSILDYVSNNSKGDLSLSNTPITSLPEELKVGKNLYLHNTPISKNHNKKQLKRMLPNVRGKIFRI